MHVNQLDFPTIVIFIFGLPPINLKLYYPKFDLPFKNPESKLKSKNN